MTRVRVEGLRELERSLGQLPRATGRNVLRRILKKRAEPVVNKAQVLAPFEEGHLEESIKVGAKLSRRQKALHRKWGSSSAVEMFIGPGPHPQAVMQEFGTAFHPAQPFLRPAWDEHKRGMLDNFAADLWTEIEKAAQRAARRAARRAAAGG